MKVSELEGALLDYWVGQAEIARTLNFQPSFGNVRIHNGRCEKTTYGENIWGPYFPSRTWQRAGPIIERERIMLSPNNSGGWSANALHEVVGVWTESHQKGATPLIAAMRCYVASKYGETVPDIEEAHA